MKTITLSLPEDLARQAESAGLLTETAIVELLREAVRRRLGDEFFEIAARFRKFDAPPLTPEEIEAEIAAARREGSTH